MVGTSLDFIVFIHSRNATKAAFMAHGKKHMIYNMPNLTYNICCITCNITCKENWQAASYLQLGTDITCQLSEFSALNLQSNWKLKVLSHGCLQQYFTDFKAVLHHTKSPHKDTPPLCLHSVAPLWDRKHPPPTPLTVLHKATYLWSSDRLSIPIPYIICPLFYARIICVWESL